MTYADCDTDAEWALFDRVRQIRRHDTTHGVYVPVAIGWWDVRLGYTHCPSCPPGPDIEAVEIDSDNSAAIGDRCDFCHVSLLEAALAAHQEGAAR